MRWETKRLFLISSKILGFLSIFKKSQPSSPLKHWTPRASRGVKRCDAPCPDEAGNLGFLYGLQRGFRHPFILREERRSCMQAISRKSDLISSQGISVSTPLEEAKSGSLSHTYCSGKTPLEVLVESCPTCSIESWESAFFSKWFRLNRAFLEFLCWNWCS